MRLSSIPAANSPAGRPTPCTACDGGLSRSLVRAPRFLRGPCRRPPRASRIESVGPAPGGRAASARDRPGNPPAAARGIDTHHACKRRGTDFARSGPGTRPEQRRGARSSFRWFPAFRNGFSRGSRVFEAPPLTFTIQMYTIRGEDFRTLTIWRSSTTNCPAAQSRFAHPGSKTRVQRLGARRPLTDRARRALAVSARAVPIRQRECQNADR
jgi:hypothetical protein